MIIGVMCLNTIEIPSVLSEKALPPFQSRKSFLLSGSFCKVELFNLWLGSLPYLMATFYFSPPSPVLHILSFNWCHNRRMFACN